MNPIPRLSFVTAALTVAGLVPAQTPSGVPTAVPVDLITEWPAALGTGPIRRVDGPYWDNCNHRSAIAVRGTVGGRAVAPAITTYVAPFDVGAPIIDFVTLPDAGLPGPQNRDGMLLSVLGGAELRFVRTLANGTISIQSIVHAGWLRASGFVARNDGTGVDVVARSMAGNTLLRTRYDYQLETFVQLPPVVLGETIRDLCLVDFDSDAAADAVVLTDTKLRVYNAGGSQLWELSLPHPGGAVESVPETGARNKFALLRRNGGNTGWALVHITGNVPSPILEQPVPITIAGNDFALVGMASGDVDGDGDFDLAIQDGGIKVLLVPNMGSGNAHFAGPQALLTAGNQTGVQGPASMLDYDYDGNADLAVPVAAANGKHYLVTMTGLPSRWALPSEDWPDIFEESYHEVEHGGTFRLFFQVPEALQDCESVTVTYYSADEAAVAGGAYAEPLQDPPPQTVTLQPDQQEVSIETLLPPGLIDYPQLLFLKVQFQSADGSSKPTFLAGATIDHTGPWANPLQLFSPFLHGNRLPSTTDKPVTRTNFSGGGRQHIGLIGAQYMLPIK